MFFIFWRVQWEAAEHAEGNGVANFSATWADHRYLSLFTSYLILFIFQNIRSQVKALFAHRRTAVALCAG